MTSKFRRSPKTYWALGSIIVALILLIVLLATTDWPFYLVWLLVGNGITFVLFRYDKFQAGRERGRVPEIVLYGLALLGGFLGGWAGMLLRPRHKTNHVLFWVVMIVSTLIHLGLIYYYLFII